MILIDYNGIAVGTVMINKGETDEDLIRHMILNQVRLYNQKFRDEYGQMIICCEDTSWRKGFFPEYKANRAKSRDNSGLDWGELFRIINLVKDELAENFPYKVIKSYKAEADDIIGTLVEYTNEFGNHEPVMIVSNDKDFLQLQKYTNVKQFSPMKKSLITEPNPNKYLIEHICKGDSSDGIPNINSGDRTFVDGMRQTPVRQKFIDNVVENYDALDQVLTEEQLRNFHRNRRLIDLSAANLEVKETIINTYESIKTAPKMKILNYLIKKRCKMLIESVEEFY